MIEPIPYITPQDRKIELAGNPNWAILHPMIGPTDIPKSVAVAYEATDRGPPCPAWVERSVISAVEQMKNKIIKKIIGTGRVKLETAASTNAFSGNKIRIDRCLPILSATAPITGLPIPSINHLKPMMKPVKVATPMV